jgi:hypothetical protein
MAVCLPHVLRFPPACMLHVTPTYQFDIFELDKVIIPINQGNVSFFK